jgi:hypothetical protein
MDAAEVVVHEVQRIRVTVILDVFEKAFVSRVNCRIDIT